MLQARTVGAALLRAHSDNARDVIKFNNRTNDHFCPRRRGDEAGRKGWGQLWNNWVDEKRGLEGSVVFALVQLRPSSSVGATCLLVWGTCSWICFFLSASFLGAWIMNVGVNLKLGRIWMTVGDSPGAELLSPKISGVCSLHPNTRVKQLRLNRTHKKLNDQTRWGLVALPPGPFFWRCTCTWMPVVISPGSVTRQSGSAMKMSHR